MAATWRVTVSSDFDPVITRVEANLLRAVDQARVPSLRVKAREQLNSFRTFQDIYISLLTGRADPSGFLHLAKQLPEGDYYALTEHGWQVLYLVDYERRTCVAVSLQRADAIARAVSHSGPRLP